MENKPEKKEWSVDRTFLDFGPITLLIGRFWDFGPRMWLYYFSDALTYHELGIDTSKGFKTPEAARAYAQQKLKKFHKELGKALEEG